MRRGRRPLSPELRATAAVAAVAALLVATVDVTAVRALPGLALVLVLPGYALSRALLPAPRPGSERGLLTVGLSLAAAVVTGVVLDRLPIGLSRGSWAVALAAVTVVAAVAAPGGRTAQAVEPTAAPRRRRAAVIAAALAVVALAGGAVVVARAPVASTRAPGYSVLWTRPVARHGNTVAVGLASYEQQVRRYHVVGVDAAGTFLDRTVTLRPHGRWTTRATARVPAGLPESVQIIVYRSDRPTTPYRHVSLTLPAASP